MAERYAIGTGNWSDVTKWDGGVSLPGASDDVHANGFTITINQDVTVLSLRTTAGAVAVAGGSFSCRSTRTITANIIGGTSNVLVSDGGAGFTVTLIGNVSAAGASRAILVAVACTYNITGTITGSSVNNGFGLQISAGTITINGNVAASNESAIWASSGSPTLTINGNVSGNGSKAGVLIGTTASLQLNGNATGSGSTNGFGISLTGNGSVIINGLAIAGVGASGVSNTSSTGTVRVLGMEHASNGYAPVAGKVFAFTANLATCKVYESNGTTNATLRAGGGGDGYIRTGGQL